MSDIPAPPPAGELVLFTTADGRAQVSCRFVGDTLWLSQADIALLFDKDPRTISDHLLNIYEEGEVDVQRTNRKFRLVRLEGASQREVVRVIEHYSLEAILAVGYRVRSQRGTQFRQWATERLNEYLLKGFTIDDERLKNPVVSGSAPPDRFDELLVRIRDIRASERRMYLRVQEIFTMADDYAPSAKETTLFFKKMQNKLHHAATGKTAAEIIQQRATATAPHMGLTTWKGDDVTKADVTVAKNYLSATEIEELNRIVVMWLDFAEDQARRRKQVFLRDWETRLDEFLRFNDRAVLIGAGSTTKSAADAHAGAEYDRFAEQRRALLEAEGERAAVEALSRIADELKTPSPPAPKPKTPATPRKKQ